MQTGEQILGNDDERRVELRKKALEAQKVLALEYMQSNEQIQLKPSKAIEDRQAEEVPPLLGVTTAHQAEEARKKALEAQKVLVLEARKHANQKARQALEARQAEDARKLVRIPKKIPFF